MSYNRHYEDLLSMIEDEIWPYAETTDRDDHRMIKVFFYDDYDEGRCYVELTEDPTSGLLSSNARCLEYLCGDDPVATDDLDAQEAYELLNLVYDDMFPGDIACDDPGYIGWLVDGVDYSVVEKPWRWRDEIYEAQELYDIDKNFDPDELADMYMLAGRTIVKNDPDNTYPENSLEFDDAASEEASCIGHLYAIKTTSKLYDMLEKWYKYNGLDMEKCVRDCFYYGGYFCFVTGDGYSKFSKELFGGGAKKTLGNGYDEVAEHMFEDWADEQ